MWTVPAVAVPLRKPTPGRGTEYEVLQFKLDVLWTMLDCMWMAYIANKPPYHNVT